MNFKAIVIGQVKDQFLGSGLEVNEMNIIIDLDKKEGSITAFLNDIEKMNEPLKAKEFSTISKLVITKIKKEFAKQYPNLNINKIYIQLKLDIEDYFIYLYYDGNEYPIEFKF